MGKEEYDKDQAPPLGDTRQDFGGRTALTLTSMVPLVGPVISGALNELIPNVRMERIEFYLRYLNDKIDELALKSSLESEFGLDLFEEGLWQSARAISKERKEYIASLVANGLVEESDVAVRLRNFLRILNLLDDRQIILLLVYHQKYSLSNSMHNNAKKFMESHGETINPMLNVVGIFDHEGREKAAPMVELNASMLGQLASLGLLDVEDSIDNIGVGSVEKSYKLTMFGYCFLEEIGVVDA